MRLRTRLQDEYNKAIRECDLFVMLFCTKVGQYTEEEFETAFGHFQTTNKPFIFTYFKDAEITTASANRKDLTSLWAFQDKLKNLGHFHTVYENIEGLKLHFNQQLDKLAANGFIALKPSRDETTVPGGTHQRATLTGPCAIAQGPGAKAVGAGGVLVGGRNEGDINTGTQIDTGGGAYVGGSGAITQGVGDALGEHSVKVSKNSGTIVTGTQIVQHYHAASNQPLTKEEIARKVAGYLRWLQERTQSIELRGIERAGGAPVVQLPLETAYVPLRANRVPQIDDADELIQTRGGTDRTPDLADHAQPGKPETDIDLNQVLGLGNRLVITGGPGSGKTTVLLHMAWALASSLLAGLPEPACSRLGLKASPSNLPLPILVPLASYARYHRNLPASASARDKNLAHFISHHLISKQANFDLPTDFFEQLLGDGADVILLLDGLDEVANEHERAEVRQSVEELVSGREAMRVIVTCRAIAYRSGRTALAADFREIAVQPLDRERHIAPMVRQAYACIHRRDRALQTDRVNDLLGGIERLEDERRTRLGKNTAALVDSPLMVRLLLIVHVNNRRLPDERADLFDKAINALLQVDYGLKASDARDLSTDWKLFRDMAQHLAFHMHRQGHDQGREIEEPTVKRVLSEETEFKPRIDDFLSHARQRGSILEEREGVYRFLHLALQEFLVARYLREVIGGESRKAILDELVDRLDDPWWREPVLLLPGYMAANATKSARGFLSALAGCGKTANAQFSAAELASTAALEWPESGAELRADCADCIVALLNSERALLDSKPVTRARAGDRLSRLGDPRLDPEQFYLPGDDLLGFVPIPADPDFRIGTRKADRQRISKIIGYEPPSREINDVATPTREFLIARYPVTVAQFRAFVDSKEFPIGDDDAVRDPDSRPVRYVSWHEALAYCEWLNEVLKTSKVLASTDVSRRVRNGKWRVDLPSELEWEKAARGGLQDAVFSWGDTPDPQRANYSDSTIGDTSAVGCFPPNDFGIYDILGNVFEWTRSLWGKDLMEPEFKYPYQENDSRRENLKAADNIRRVVRGGSWFSVRDFARCAFRYWFLSVFRFDFLGFRVVLRCAPVP